jgi:general secretion pathway protein G
MGFESGPPQRRRGFTLIEIMAVVLIIGMLTGMVGLAVWRRVDTARVQSTRSQIKLLEGVLEAYRMDNATFPTTEQGLSALIQPPPEARNADPGGYLNERRVPKDGWGHSFQYQFPGEHNPGAFDLWSLGGDGNPGGTGTDADIGNWVDDGQEQAG